MAILDAMKWSKRASIIYALGVWTMIGSYAYMKYTGRFPDKPVPKPEEVEEPENPYQVVYETAYNKTVITYRKDSFRST